MTCPNCPSEVPIIQASLAPILLLATRERRLTVATQLSMQWLLERHPGVQFYEGIVGREYTPEEAPRLAEDQAELAKLPCPFFLETGCVFGRKGLDARYLVERRGADYGFLPMLIVLCADRANLRHLAASKEIASAKTGLMTRPHTFYTRRNRITDQRETVRSRDVIAPKAQAAEAALVG